MTAQCHKILIYERNKSSMAFCPPLPENHPRIWKNLPWYKNRFGDDDDFNYYFNLKIVSFYYV